LPTVLSVAERLRTALLSRSDGAPVFGGHEAEGGVRQGHQHALYLPSDDDGDGRIDHLAVWAQGGFDERAIAALQELRKVWGSDGHDLHLVLVGLGHPEDYGGMERGGATTPIAAKARTWQSVTPFVLTRHPKRRRGVWLDTPEDQVRRACEQLTGVTPREVVRTTGTERPSTWRGFYLERKHGNGSRASERPYGFRLTFDVAVRGPIALGYGAHFGLGQFVAVAAP
jgi:CRISPR-associated protein Csb2